MEVKNKKTFFKSYNKINDNNVVIMWDYKPILKKNAKGVEIETPLAVWQQHVFDHVPTLTEIKNVVIEYYNKEIDKQILSGLTWNGMQIWLSTENQFNYKTAYDLAIQTNGETLPITFKFGNNEKSIYYKFENLEDLTDFYSTSVKYVQKTLNDGWLKKDSINWDFFKKN